MGTEKAEFVADEKNTRDAGGKGADHPAAEALGDLAKVKDIMEAFDRDGDGHLNFEEARALRHLTTGGLDFARRKYAEVCARTGSSMAKGLNLVALQKLYASLGTLI